jgi:hypothetical protein
MACDCSHRSPGTYRVAVHAVWHPRNSMWFDVSGSPLPGQDGAKMVHSDFRQRNISYCVGAQPIDALGSAAGLATNVVCVSSSRCPRRVSLPPGPFFLVPLRPSLRSSLF